LSPASNIEHSLLAVIVAALWFVRAGGPDMLSKEVRVTRFKQLLLEGGVNAFSLYAKVKAKLDKDER
jgi:hypothetical protein